MQFDLISDVHADYWGDAAAIDWAAKKRSAIAVIAGDLAASLAGHEAELRRIASVYERVLVVDGNHEHRPYFPDFTIAPSLLSQLIASMPNVDFLPDAPVVIDGVAFMGANGWWDFELAMPEIDAENVKRDYAQHWQQFPQLVPELLALADAQCQRLKNDIIAMQQRADVHSIVIVTHTQPHHDLLDWNYFPADPRNNVFNGNRGMMRLPAFDTAQKIKCWLYGHSHAAQDMQIGHIRYVCNARGRPSDFNRRDYDPVAIKVTEGVPPLLLNNPSTPSSNQWGPSVRQPTNPPPPKPPTPGMP